jgi:DNA-binding NarL/FixJ family response regulator
VHLSITGCSAPYTEAVQSQLDHLGLLDNPADERRIAMVFCETDAQWELLSTEAEHADTVAIAVLPTFDLDGYAQALVTGASGVVYVDTPSSMTAEAVRAATQGEVMLPQPAAQGLAALARREKPATDLDDREIELLRAVARGRPIVDIAKEMYFSERTVRRHLYGICVKLGVRNRAEAIAKATRLGIVDTD